MQAGPSEPDNFPFVVLGNKSDLPQSDHRVPRAKAEQWCKSKSADGGMVRCAPACQPPACPLTPAPTQPISYFETSAKENTNVEQAFQQVAKMALKNEEDTDKMCGRHPLPRLHRAARALT